MRKKSIWKKMMSTLLAAVMVMTAVPVSASGFETEETDSIPFEAVSNEEGTEAFRAEILLTEDGETGGTQDPSEETEDNVADNGDVAQVGDTKYSSLQEAVNAAEADGTVKMIADTDITGTGLSITKSVTLDLAGKKITADNGTGNIRVQSGATLTLEDSGNSGQIVSSMDYQKNRYSSGIIHVTGGSHFVMNGGTVDAVRENPVNNGQFGITVMEEGSSVTINGGTIRAGWYAVSGNGLSENSGTVITINGGELISTADYAIYHPQSGTLKINGGVISGAAGGISMNAGSLEVKDGTIKYTGGGDTGEWGDGTGFDGNAVFSFGAKYDPVNVKIQGGKFVAEPENGTILNKDFGSDHQGELKEFVISGGYFESSADLTGELGIYLEDGLAFYNGNVVSDVVATIGETTYTSIQSAVDAAGDNATIVLARDVTESVTVEAGKNIVLDLNGKIWEAESGAPLTINGGICTITDSTANAAPAVSEDYETVTYVSGKIRGLNGSDGTNIYNGGTLTLRSGMVESTAGNGINVGAKNLTGVSTLNMEGGYVSSREYGIGVYGNKGILNMTGGVVTAQDNAAIAGNGAGSGGTEIHIKDGTIIGHIVTDNFIACGIYHPQEGILEISGGTIYADGGVGVLMRAGTLNMTSGTIQATGTEQGWVGDREINVPSSGIVIDEAADYPDAKSGLGGAVSGGSVKSETTDVVTVLKKDSGGADDLDLLSITGGIFTPEVNEAYVKPGYMWHEENGEVKETYHTVKFYVPYADIMAPADVQVGHNMGMNAPTVAVPEGYLFANEWYTDPSYTEASKWDFDADIVTADLTLYAKITKTAGENEVQVVVPPINGENPPAATEKPQIGMNTSGGASSDASQAENIIADITKDILDPQKDVPDGVVSSDGDELNAGERKAIQDTGENLETRVVIDTAAEEPENRNDYIKAAGLQTDSDATTVFTDIQVQLIDTSQNGKILGRITETSSPLTFTVILPTTLDGQWVEVVREHDGKVEKLTDVVREPGKVIFQADKFSTYALVGTADAHTVTFDANGGSLSGNTVAVVKDKTKLDSYPTASRSGYTFTGWYTDSACTTYWRTDSAFSTDTTLYAGWQKYTPPTPVSYYKVTFDSQGGSEVQGLSNVREWTHISEPAAPTREGYVFAGWYKDSACVTPWDFAKDYVTSDITLYAKWTEEEPELVIPGAPQVKVVSKTSSQVKISWEPVEGADGYTVWVREEDSTKYVRRYIHYGNIDCEYTRKNLDPGTKYFFIVRSWVQDEDGNYHFSEMSDTVRGTTKPEQAKIKEIVVNASGDIKVRLEEAAPGATHYAMCWSRHADYSIYKIGIRTIYPTRTIAKGMAKGTYYVKVRPYRQLENSRVYADWEEVPVKVVVK